MNAWEYLQQRGLSPKKAGKNEARILCPFCSEPEGKRGRLYVHLGGEEDGLHFCFLCQAKGNLITLKRFFGDATDEDVASDPFSVHLEILAEATSYYHECLADHDDAFKWLKESRGLTLDTITKHQIGYADGTLHGHLRDKGFRIPDVLKSGLVIDDRRQRRLTDTLTNMITIPYHTANQVTLLRGRAFPYNSDGPKYKTPSNQKTRLFNNDAVWQTEELVMCEGEFDALVLSQLGFAAVGVPGANVWQDSWDGYFEDIKRVYLCFDQDKAGIEGATKLKERFGPKCKIVEMPPHKDGEPKNDPTHWITQLGHTAEDFRQLLNNSDATGLLVTVDQAAEEHAEIQGIPGIQSGVEGIDSAISPGFLPMQLMIMLGKTGASKTLSTLNFMHRMSMKDPKLKFLFVSLEQTRGEWFERARRIYRFYNLYATDEEVKDYWRSRLLLVDKNRLTEIDLNTVLDDYEYRMGRLPDVVAVDYLGYWARAFRGDQYERTSDAVMALKKIAKERKVFILAPHQVNRGARFGQEFEADAGRDSGVVEETADFVFNIWSADHAAIPQNGTAQEHRTGVVNLRITKSRHGGRGQQVIFQFAPQSLVLLPHIDANPMHKRWMEMARHELYYQSIGEPWEVSHDRHRGDMPEGSRQDRPRQKPAAMRQLQIVKD